MQRPIGTRNAVGYFGAILGSLVPASILLKISAESNGDLSNPIVILLFALASTVTATVGYLSGYSVASLLTSIKRYSWSQYILLNLAAGIVWGGFSGAVGGIFLFLIGGLVGAVIGAVTGGIALPIFAVIYRTLSKGNAIELKHFLPAAFGIVLTICAFIMGL
jgi:hypothetical protein